MIYQSTQYDKRVVGVGKLPGIANELINEDNGVIIPTNDENAMTKAMQMLLKNNDIRCNMGLKNREKCKQYYTKNIIAEWEKAINHIS